MSVSEIFQNEPKLRRLAPNSNWVEASLVAAQVHGEEVVEALEEMMIRATDPSSG